MVIFVLLIYVDYATALIMFFVLGTAYVVIYLLQRNYLHRLGKLRIEMNSKRFQSLLEAFNGIKTVMVYQRKEVFERRFALASRGFYDIQPKFHIIQSSPRNLLEILAFRPARKLV